MLLLPFRLGVGAILGSGRQRVSWIHLEDLLRLIATAITQDSLRGGINAVAPDSPTFEEFARLVAKQLHRPLFLRIPAKLLRRLLGEMATMFVEGPHIVPKRLNKAAFEYRFPSLRSALMDLT